MAETTNPTDQEFLDGLQFVDNDATLIYNEVVRRLRLNLPAKIAAMNTKLGYVSGYGIPIPDVDDIKLAPAVYDDNSINSVLVGGSVKTVSTAPRVFKNIVQVVVFSIDADIRTSYQASLVWQRAAAIRGVLYHFLTGCVDDQNRKCWNLMKPQGVMLLGNDATAKYFGSQCIYETVLQPEGNNWTV